jgi:hypothetical protein
VNYDYLKEIAREYGLELVSVRGFGEIYDSALDKKTEWLEDLKNMSAGEKLFSFLHNEFIFEKKKNAGDQTYDKLLKLIAKREKKEERMSKFNNNRIRMKVKSGGRPIVRKNSEDNSNSESEVTITDNESTDNSEKTITIPDEITGVSEASDDTVKSIEIPDKK